MTMGRQLKYAMKTKKKNAAKGNGSNCTLYEILSHEMVIYFMTC